MPGTTPTILLVGGASEPTWPYWETRFEQAGLAIDRADHVYLALARIGRGKTDPTAVIVCVDFLDSSEFEFFELVSRNRPRTAVYAWGSPEASDKLEQAVRAGAREILTAERFEKLLHEFGESPAALVAEPGERTDAAASQGTPVPWRRTTAGPARTPPSRRERPAPIAPRGSAPRSANHVREGEEPNNLDDSELFDGPLLSPEELELLMSDDFRTLPRQPSEREEDAD